ncbi:MAG: xanthine dehydrogenase family protein molybdopterin-binding subunit [Proteobacteria bacterium]|nr:xanthine dehydrogenase family protein molybdopterin-binding subunit [Pseudomonadota bacterium]
MSDFSLIGKSAIRPDAFDKVTGRAKFASEEGLGLPGMLFGKILFSPVAHAKILSIDTSEAEQVSGVKVILTGKDAPSHRAGLFIDDRHILCHERVRFIGDAVAAVAAESSEAALKALGLIRVRYEELPALFSAEEAIREDCPVVLHPDLPHYDRSIYDYLGEDLPSRNAHTHHKIRRGDVQEGFRNADLIIENRFSNDRITHCQLEPYNAVAYPESDGSVTLWTSGRPYYTQRPICRAFNLPPSKLRVKTRYIGGMFGKQARPERFAVLLALKTGKPTKLVYSREECFFDGLNRLPMVVYLKDGVRDDGVLLAREMRVIVNTGGYAENAPLIIRNASFHASQYRIPNFKWDAYGVYTNEPPSGAMRGFGSAECLWATEQQMEIIAHELGLESLEVRKRNTVDEGDEDVRGEIVHSVGAKQCLEKVAEWIRWGEPCESSHGSLRRGKGLALGNKYTMADSASSVVVKVHSDGTIEVRHGTDECGQGCNTVLAQIAGEEFGLSFDDVKIVWGDTGIVPYDFGAVSSRSTLYVGNALLLACRDAKRQLFELASERLGVTPQELDVRDKEIFIRNSPEKKLAVSDLFLGRHPEARGAVRPATCLPEGGEILGKATFWGHPSEEDPETGQGKRLTISYCYGAQAAEVEIDTETGIVKVLRFCSAFDVGRAINPKLCEVQMEGGAGMGIGSALYEGFVFSRKGQILNPNFTDYRIPSSMEVPSGPNMKSIIVEAPHSEGPFGAKGMGEAPMNPAAPAIANAIFNAIGIRLKDLPMTPERVLNAIKSSKRLISR